MHPVDLAVALKRVASKLTLVPIFAFFLIATTLSAAPAYVTGASKGCPSVSSCSVSLTGTNAGDLIVLGLFVSDSTSVSSVTDSQGATFTLIGSSQTWGGSFVERLYYAKNVAAGSHTITVNLSGIPSYSLEVHTYDYSGLDTSSPFDVSATPKTGTGTSGTTNSVTTTNANDLLFAFFHSDNGVTNTAGSGFTGRTPTTDTYPLGEDNNVTSTNSYSATMSYSASADYVGFLVAFKAASGGSPNITSLSPTSGSVGTSVTITGTNFGSAQGSSTVKFNTTVATPTSWSATSIVAPVPSGATTGSVVVTVGGVASTGNPTFTVSGAPAYVTGVSKGCPSVSSCSVSLTGTNAGDLIVLGLFVSDSTSVSSVTDSQGATFTLIGSSQTWGGSFVERFYYAKNVAAGSHTITVNLSGIPSYSLEVHTYDYSGLDTSSPFDVSATPKTGTGTSGTTNSVTTTNANDLLFAFFHSDNGVTNTAGSGFTGRTPTTDTYPLGEDNNVTSTNSYSATMSYSASADYVGFLVAFKAASGGGGGGSPSISAVHDWPGDVITSGTIGEWVGILGSGFGATQGSSTVTFGGTPATVNGWSANTLYTTVPSGANTGNLVVTVAGVASSGYSFTVLPGPSIVNVDDYSSLTTHSGTIGEVLDINGGGFGASQGSSTVTFNGTPATVNTWSTYTLYTSVPSGATPGPGNIVVTVAGVASNAYSFTVLSGPSIVTVHDHNDLPTNSGTIGQVLAIYGGGFGPSQGSSTVTFNGTPAIVNTWSASGINTNVPNGATTGNLVVTVAGLASNGYSFTVTGPSPSIASLSPNSGPVGTSVTITGTNFGGSQGTSTVTFSGTAATPTSWSATSIVAPVPSGATTGNAVVTVSGVASNGVSFRVLSPTITSLSPTSGAVGTSVTITGTNFGSSQGSSTVKFNGTTATPTSWSATSIAAPVPSGGTTGNVVITVSGVASNGVSFTVTGSSSIYYYIEDSLGTSRVITDSSGNLCYDADFYPFGGERTPYTMNCAQNYKFTGKERDSESNLDNFGARYDSSALGRFMSPDPENLSAASHMDDPQSWNAYAYVRNNPLTLTDPTGENYIVCDQNGQNCGDLSDTQYQQFLSENRDVSVDASGQIWVTNDNGSQVKAGAATYYNQQDVQAAGQITGLEKPLAILGGAEAAFILGPGMGMLEGTLPGVGLTGGLDLGSAARTGSGPGTLQDVLAGATNTGSDLGWQKSGGATQATKDFNAFAGQTVKAGNVTIKEVPGVGRVVLRTDPGTLSSKGGLPTLEIQPSGGGSKNIAIRYNP